MQKIAAGSLLVFLIACDAFAALKINDPAPLFSLQDAAKNEFSLGHIVGAASKEKRNGVVLSLFASWCVPCRKELPILNSLVDELNGKGVKVVVIGVREDFQTIRSLLAELNVDKPVVLSDRDGKVAGLYQVRFLPTTFFIGPDRTIKDIIFGEISGQAELRRSVEKLLK